MLGNILILFTLLLVQTTTSKKFIKPRTLSSTRLVKAAQSVDYEAFKDILSPILRSRVPGTKGHRFVKEFISKFMDDLGWDVKFDTFDQNTTIGPKRFTNIVSTANPNAKKFLVLTAHYDTKIIPTVRGKEFIAATDSAVPVAMMMYIASQLNLQELRKNNEYTLQLAFFDGEEAFKEWTETDSIYGSRHLALLWSQADESGVPHLQSIDTLILFDLIGAKNPRFYSFFSETHERYYMHLLKIQSSLMQVQQIASRYFFQGLYDGLGMQDDHLPFLRKGVPILHIIPYPFPDCWHQLCDDGDSIDQNTVHDLLKIFLVFFKENMKV